MSNNLPKIFILIKYTLWGYTWQIKYYLKFLYNMVVKKMWFKRKRYGFGWYPSTWEGWFILFIWLAVLILELVKVDNVWPRNILFVLIMIGILSYIMYERGERPKWQWGEEEKNNLEKQ